MGRRLRVVPDGAGAPAVALAYGSHLPVTLHAALEDAHGRWDGEAWGIERVGPDHFRVVLDCTADDTGMEFTPIVWLDLPAPPLRQAYREVYLHAPGLPEPLEVSPRSLASALIACGFSVAPPQPKQGEPRPRKLLWEAPGGLGDPALIAPWAKEG